MNVEDFEAERLREEENGLLSHKRAWQETILTHYPTLGRSNPRPNFWGTLSMAWQNVVDTLSHLHDTHQNTSSSRDDDR